jgi:hypothetical protein
MVIQDDPFISSLQHLHVLCWHLELIFSECEQPTERYIRVGDVMLPGGQKLEIIAFLKNRAITCGDIQTAIRHKGE